jgi:hypothetical protein
MLCYTTMLGWWEYAFYAIIYMFLTNIRLMILCCTYVPFGISGFLEQ